jgi:hypothetical protein
MCRAEQTCPLARARCCRDALDCNAVSRFPRWSFISSGQGDARPLLLQFPLARHAYCNSQYCRINSPWNKVTAKQPSSSKSLYGTKVTSQSAYWEIIEVLGHVRTSAKLTKLRGLSPRARSTDGSTAAYRRIVPTFEDRGCDVVNAMDPYGRILGSLGSHLRRWENLEELQETGGLVRNCLRNWGKHREPSQYNHSSSRNTNREPPEHKQTNKQTNKQTLPVMQAHSVRRYQV